MKKSFRRLLYLVLAFVLLNGLPVTAKSGDIVGEYYATDIYTYLNGARISAINIGGETLISAEDMEQFGFYVWWDQTERTLRIHENTGAVSTQVSPIPENMTPAGTPIGYYYETDIVTYLDSIPITAYNIGGRTYIHAEEMRRFGYDVIWNPDKWTLEIISPRQAGYVYSIPLSYGTDKGWGNGNPGVDGIGVCSIKYTPDGLVGTDDADYFNMTMSSSGREYRFDMVFYQTQGLFNSSLLQDKLRPLCYEGYGVEVSCDKSEKYDLVNQFVSISINGYQAEKISVIGGAGNGHRDFYFIVEDIPRLKKEEIQEIVFSVGDSFGKSYEIKVPDFVRNGPDGIAEAVKKSYRDEVVTYYQTDEAYIYYVKEYISVGKVCDRLYIYDRRTHKVSDDILEKVRMLPDFQYDIINPFAFKIGEVKSNFFFSCNTPKKTMDFYVDLNSGALYDAEGSQI